MQLIKQDGAYKMVYQDDPNSPADDDGDVEIPLCRDDPRDANEYDIAKPAVQSTSGRSSRCKALLAVFFLAALGVGGWEYYDYSQGGSGRGSSSNWVNDLDILKGRLSPKKVGVRGSDQEEDDSADHETVAEIIQEVEVSAKTPESSKATTHPSTEPPTPTEECEDDPTFVHANLKTCATFVAKVGRPALRAARCIQSTGITDGNGVAFEVRHFCRNSCAMCDENTLAERTKSEYAQELKALEEKQQQQEEDGVVVEVEEEGNQGSANEGEVSEEDSDLREELKEQDNDSEGVLTQDSESFGNGDGGDSGDESNIVDNEPSGEEVDEEGGYVSEGKNHEPPAGDEDTAPRLPPDSETFEDQEGEELPDYFAPLTELERDALKERLRGANEGEVSEEDSDLWERLKEQENKLKEQENIWKEYHLRMNALESDKGDSGDESNSVDNEPSGQEVDD